MTKNISKYKNYIALYIDILGFSEISKNSGEYKKKDAKRYLKKTNNNRGINNTKIGAYFDLINKLKATVNHHNKYIGEEYKIISFSDSILIYIEINKYEKKKDPTIPKKLAGVLAIGKHIQSELFFTNAILSRGLVKIGEGSFGELDGVYVGPLLTILVEHEKRIKFPIIYISKYLKRKIENRNITLKEIAFRQFDSTSLKIKEIGSGQSFIDYFDINIKDKTYVPNLRMILITACEVFCTKNPEVIEKWIWIVDQLLLQDLPKFDNKEGSFLEALNSKLSNNSFEEFKIKNKKLLKKQMHEV